MRELEKMATVVRQWWAVSFHCSSCYTCPCNNINKDSMAAVCYQQETLPRYFHFIPNAVSRLQLYLCASLFVTDFVAACFEMNASLFHCNSQNSAVWEITGAEFSKSDSHTARGISIRFPRCTKMRDDKSWAEATNLEELAVRNLM